MSDTMNSSLNVYEVIEGLEELDQNEKQKWCSDVKKQSSNIKSA